jgi:hypothetical protein
MSTMLVEIYDALKEAGASEEKARAAATSLTGRDRRWDEVDQRFQRVEQRLRRARAPDQDLLLVKVSEL